MSSNEGAYMPLHGSEVTQMQFIHSLYKCLKDENSLESRLKSIGMWWRYKGLVTQLANMFDALWKTVEPEKRVRMNMIWEQQELRIVNGSQAVDPTGDLMMIPKTAIVNMARELQKEKCAICMGNNNDRKDCMFRRAMVDMAIPDIRREEKKSGKCMGHLFNWEE